MLFEGRETKHCRSCKEDVEMLLAVQPHVLEALLIVVVVVPRNINSEINNSQDFQLDFVEMVRVEA